MKNPKKYFLLFGILILLLVIYFLYQKIILINKSRNLNLILISVDTLRPDHMGVYGYNRNTTPNIDKWAKDAMVFTNAYTIIPLTYPSFTALMTGRYPIETKIINNDDGPIPKKIETLSETLKRNGYMTGAALTNAALDKDLTNLDRGFDYYKINDSEVEKGGVADYLKFIENGFNWIIQNKQKPFFFWFHIQTPHAPYYPPAQFRYTFSQSYEDTIEGISFNEAREKQNELVKEIKCYKQDSDKNKKYLEELIDTYTRLYDEDIIYGDYIFKHIIDNINKTGLDKNSIIIFYGDHGESFDHGYYFNHGRVIYNSSVRIPLMIKLPNNLRKKINYLIDNTSIYFILKDLISNSIDIPTSFKDINALTKKYSKEKIYFIDNAATRGSLIDGKYQYIKTLKGDCLSQNNEELYDLNIDKVENINLINQVEHKNKIDGFRKEFENNYFKYFPLEKKDLNNSQEKLDKLKSLGY